MYVVTGPTASGKSQLAYDLSSAMNLRQVNADAFQFYQELSIISNREPAPADSLFFAHQSLTGPLMNSGDYSRALRAQVDPRESNHYLLVGCGLYLGSALYGLDEDRRKGTPFQGEPLYKYRMIVLDPERSELYERINQRVDEMISKGAVAEAQAVKSLVDAGKVSRSHPALRAIGLKHLLELLDLAHPDESQQKKMIELWKRDTRRLAKRQWTWLRKFCAPSENRIWLREPKQAKSLLFSEQ